MTPVFFTAETLNTWRRKLRHEGHPTWAELESLNEGWCPSPRSPHALIDALAPLVAIREGWKLDGWINGGAEDSMGVVWALPVGSTSHVPAHAKLSDIRSHRPALAAKILSEALITDGTDLGHLALALVNLELHEFGSGGHGAWWSDYIIIDRPPWEAWNDEGRKISRNSDGWDRPLPVELRPQVIHEERGVRVTFYAYSTFFKERVDQFDTLIDPVMHGIIGSGNDTLAEGPGFALH